MKNKTGKRTVWTMGYFPLQMGGNINRPISTEVTMIEEIIVGKGLKAFSFKTPKGTIRIAESITGAIVGESFEGVRDDISSTTKKIATDQIKDAKSILKQRGCESMTNKEFFKIYNH